MKALNISIVLNYSKKIMIVFVLLISLFGITISVQAADGNAKKTLNYGDWEGYINSDGTFTLVGVYRGVSPYINGTLSLPSDVEGHKVTRIEGLEGHIIGDSWHDSFDIFSPEIVKTLIIPDTVSYIEYDCFNNFNRVEKLVLPNNKEFFDDSNDNGNYNEFCLKNDNLWKTVKDLSALNISWYLEAKKLETIRFYDGEEWFRVGNDENIPNLKNIYFPKTARNVNIYDFDGNIHFEKGLKELYLENASNVLSNTNLPTTLNVLGVGDDSTTSVLKVPYSVECLYLANCRILTNISSERGIENINIPQATDCPNLKIPIYLHAANGEITPGAELGNYDSPYNNSGITSITMDEDNFYLFDINIYSKEWFRGMKNLKSINVRTSKNQYSKMKNFYSKDGVLYWSEDGKYENEDDLLAYPAAKSTTGNLTLPTWVKCVYGYAFDNCKFEYITVPEKASPNYYWDRVAEYIDGDWETFSVLNNCNAKVKVIKGSSGMGRVAESKVDLANELKVTSDRVIFYKGSKYKIEYDLNGGKNNKNNPTSYVAGDDIITLKNPTRKGYIFCGWVRNDGSDYNNTTKRIDYFKNYKYTAQWTKIKAIKSLKVKSLKKNKVKITWKKVKGVKGYQIQYALNKKFTKKKKSVFAKGNNKTIKNLKKKTYYLRVRSYKVVRKKKIYGKWSDTKKVKNK